MWISLGNVDAMVSRATEAEHKFLWNYLSFEDTSSSYARAKGLMGGWDGRIHLYDRRRSTFPAGLLPLLRKGAARAGHRLEVSDTRARPHVLDPGSEHGKTTWLDPEREQPQCLRACLEAGRGIVWAPTGSGKTEIFSALTKVVPGNWLVLVTAKDLLHQAAERIKLRNGEDPGVCGDGEWAPARVTVSTVQTLHRRLQDGRARDLLEAAGGVIADEAHQVPGKQFSDVMRACPNAYWRFGFSGTPLARGDRRNLLLVAAVGEVVYRIKASDLIERGVLSRPRIKFLPLHQAVSGETWQEVYQAGVVESVRRNALITGLAASVPRPCLLTVRLIEHGKKLRQMLERRGINTQFVWGDDGSHERKMSIQGLRRGDTDVLIASTIFDVGVDIPELASIVNAGGGKSAIKTLQRLGRGMRVADGKTEIEMYDIADLGAAWLKEHSRARQRIYRNEGFEVTVGTEADAELAAMKGRLEPGPR